MKKLLALLVVMVLCVFSLAACFNFNKEDPHVHTYKDSWTSDDKNHWHEATCDCQDVTEEKIAHTDANKDGACDVCKTQYECKDGHSYAEEWTSDATAHWHAADCGHTVDAVDKAAHADVNGDGKCDTCAYVVGELHTHTFSDEWSSDEAYHWHAANCGHANEIADKAAHVLNAAGECTVCGATVTEIDQNSIAIVLNAALASNNKIVDGSVIASQIVYSGSGNDMYISAILVNDIYFVLGNNASNIVWTTLDENGEAVGIVENWYELVGEEVFGVEKLDGVFAPVAGTMNHLNGYTYNPGSILPGMDVDTSTLANTLAAIYALKVEGVRVSDATENYDAATGIYTFAFKYFTVDAASQSDGSVHYQVEVYYVDAEFTVDDNFVIDTCELNVSVFRNIEQDMDFDYDPATDTYTLRAEANPSVYSYVVKQTSGERTFTNPYSREDLIPDSFDYYIADVEMLEDEEGVAYNNVILKDMILESINVKPNTQLYIALSNIQPGTFSHSFINISDFEISFVNKTAGDEGVLFVANEYNPTYSHMWNYGYIAIFVKDAGTYTLTIKYADTVKSFDVVVEAEQSGEIVVGENEILVETTDTYGFFDEYTFVAENGEGKYTFTVPAGLGFWSKANSDSNPFGEPEVGFYSNENGDTVVVELTANEEYVFYVGSINRGQWIISYTYEASEVGGGSQDSVEVPLTIGNIQINAADAVYVYTAAGEGVLTLTSGAAIMGPVEISYAINGGDSNVLALSSSVSLELSAGDKVVVNIVASGYSSLTAAWDGPTEEPNPEPEEAVLVVGENTVTISAEEAAEGGKEFTFTTTEAGTYTFASNDVGVRIFDNGMMLGTGIVDLEANKTYTAFVLAMGEGTYTVNISVEAVAGGNEEGTMDNPIVLDSIPSELVFENAHDVYYTYTASEAATIIISKTQGSYMSVTAEDYDSEYNDDYTNCTYTVYVKAGETITLNPWSEGEGTFVYTFEVGAAVISGSFDKPFEINDYTDSDITCEYPGGNDSELFVWYKYTAYKTGTLTLTMGSRAVVKYGADAENLETAMNQQTITFNIEAYSNYYIAVQSSDLSAANIEFSFLSEYILGSEDRPFEISDITAEQNCNYAGTDIWYSFVGGDEGGYVTLSSAYATAKLGGGVSTYSISYNDSEAYGSVRFYVEAYQTAYVVIGDWAPNASAEIAFTLSFEAGEHELDGSYEYPFEATLGEGTCNFGGGWNYVWYSLTVAETGTLTISSDNANASFVISPMTSEYAEGAKLGIGSVSYGTNAGVCYIGIATENTEAGEIAYTISFEAGELEPDGTSLLPFTAVAGDNTCAFPGGMTPVWYAITVDAPCTITVSSDYVSSALNHALGCSESDCAWIVVSPEPDTYSSDAVSNSWNIGSDVVYEATQAGTYYIAIADWCEAAGDIVFNVTVG